VLIKIKIQGKKEDIPEFLDRLKEVYPNLDCQQLEETQMYQNNHGRGVFFRKYVRLGMNIRNGKTEKKFQTKNRY
jgi:hypothetical protein